MKRSYLIIISVVVLLVVGAGLYFLLPHSTAQPSQTSTSTLPIAGNQQGTPSGATTGVSTGTTSTSTSSRMRLVEIAQGPIVPGESVVDVPAADASSSPDVKVSYIEQQSGNIFSYLENTRITTRTSNKTIPGIQEAQWTPDGSMAYVQYLSGTSYQTVNTYALPATGAGGFFLPQGLTGLAVSGHGVLTLAPAADGSVASLERFDGSSASQVFTTPLTQLRVSFAGKSDYLVFSKPAASLNGDAYIVSNAGHFSRIAGALKGLTALASPSGQWVFISYMDGSDLRTALVESATGTTIPLPLATLADKCAWTPDSGALYCGVPVSIDSSYTYPDDWYQGVVHFSDQLWKVDIASRVAQRVLDFSSANKGALDAEALAIDPDNTTLVFVNKNDGSLWSYALK